MESGPAVILFAPAGGELGSARASPGLAPGLRDFGFAVCPCPDLRHLPDCIIDAGAGSCLVLAGTPTQNCLAASLARTLEQGLGIVALVPPQHEQAMIQVLSSGADTYCVRGVSIELVAAVLSALLRRLRQSAMGRPSPRWSMQEQGWVLAGPGGCRVPLTTGERAFLDALLKAPGMRASHDVLTAAVNAAYGAAGKSRQVRQLGLLVSRMRRKCEDQGAALPLHSVHGWGYMFAQGTPAA
jgi:DNA-binding response OmpR family regulator